MFRRHTTASLPEPISKEQAGLPETGATADDDEPLVTGGPIQTMVKQYPLLENPVIVMPVVKYGFAKEAAKLATEGWRVRAMVSIPVLKGSLLVVTFERPTPA